MSSDLSITATFNASGGVAGTYTGQFTGAVKQFPLGWTACELNHSFFANIVTLKLSGSGTAGSPYSGTFSGGGTDTVTVLNNRDNSSTCHGYSTPFNLTGTLSGSSGKVTGTGSLTSDYTGSSTVGQINLSEGTVTGNTLTITLKVTFDEDWGFESGLTKTLQLTKSQ
jgi:hypothetical protein